MVVLVCVLVMCVEMVGGDVEMVVSEIGSDEIVGGNVEMVGGDENTWYWRSDNTGSGTMH